VRRRIIRAPFLPFRPIRAARAAAYPRKTRTASVSDAVRRASGSELAAALELRRRVFCEEQGVPEELERDRDDATAIHLVSVDPSGAVMATCRLVRRGPVMALQRMAVDRVARGRGVGTRLLDAAHAEAAAAGADEVELHAQVAVRDFYARAGYVPEGAEFEEAGIAHVVMRRALP
jgi:predicted GNAT family N-acyltransferase